MFDNRDNNSLADFGLLINAMSGGGDTGNIFPASDADDLRQGARFIPGEVTQARRQGQNVLFVTDCGPCCWYWQMPDGSRIFHWDRPTYQQIAHRNGYHTEGVINGLVGSCPACGNPHTQGGHIRLENIKA